MNDILSHLEKIAYPEELPSEYFELLKKQDPYLKTIQEQLSLDFLDGFYDTQSEGIKWERREAFSRGFRLGARLILALAEPSAPDTHHSSSAYQ